MSNSYLRSVLNALYVHGMNKQINEDIHFRVMQILEENPEISQRELAERLNVSLGSVNFCVKALVDKSLIKVRNFRNSDKKLRYAYFLTPQGLAEKTALAGRFLQRKMAEFEALKEEIAQLEKSISDSETESDDQFSAYKKTGK